MTDLTGRVAAVNTLPLGSALSDDAPAGATVITVDDSADFDETGGHVVLSGGNAAVPGASFVQAFSSTSTTSSTTRTAAVGAAVPVGAVLVAVVASGGTTAQATPTAVTDAAGNVWSLAAASTADAAKTSVYVAKVTAPLAPGQLVTATFASASTNSRVHVLHYSGLTGATVAGGGVDSFTIAVGGTTTYTATPAGTALALAVGAAANGAAWAADSLGGDVAWQSRVATAKVAIAETAAADEVSVTATWPTSSGTAGALGIVFLALAPVEEAPAETRVVEYVAADDEAGELVLAAPLDVAFYAGDAVHLWDAALAAPVVETVAQVLVEGEEQPGDALEALVDHALIAYLAEGLRSPDEAESVELAWRGDDLYVTNVTGRAPLMDGSVIDPETLPPSGGGMVPEVPETPLAPEVLGGIGSLLIRWTPVVHVNPVTYAVYVSPTSPVVPSPQTFVGEVSGSQLTVRRLPIPNVELGTPDSPLAYGTDYYTVVVAKDAADPTYASAPSAEASGSPVQAQAGDLAADSVTAAQVVAGSITGEALAGEIALVSTIKTAEAGQRVELSGENGFRMFNSAEELRVEFPTAPGADPQIRGVIQADGLTVREGATFFSPLNSFAKDSTISLDESLARPASAPGATIYWNSYQLEQREVTGNAGTFALDPTQIVGAGWHDGLGCVMVIQRHPSGRNRVWYHDLDGSLMSGLSPGPYYDLPAGWDVTSVASKPNGKLVMMFQFEGADWWIWDDSLPAGSQTRRYTPITSGNFRPILTTDGSDVVVSETSGGRTWFRTVDTSTSPVTVVGASTLTTGDPDKNVSPNFLYRGSAGGFSGTRWVTSYPGTWIYRVFNTSGAYQSAENWQPPVAKAGGVFMKSLGVFGTIGQDGRLYQHSPLTWTDSALDTWHFGQTFYDSNATGGTHETALGEVRSFTMLKRAFVRFTLVEVPYAGGADDPNQWRLYGMRGAYAASGMRLQASGPYTTLTTSMGLAPNTAGAVAPTVSTFPGGNPAKLVSARTLPADASKPIIELRGDGAGRFGSLAVDATGVVSFGGLPDTPWTDLPVASGVTYPIRRPQYRRKNGIVYLRGWAQTVDSASGSIIGTLPVGFRPDSGQSLQELGFLGASGGTSFTAVYVESATGHIRKRGSVTDVLLGGSFPAAEA